MDSTKLQAVCYNQPGPGGYRDWHGLPCHPLRLQGNLPVPTISFHELLSVFDKTAQTKENIDRFLTNVGHPSDLIQQAVMVVGHEHHFVVILFDLAKGLCVMCDPSFDEAGVVLLQGTLSDDVLGVVRYQFVRHFLDAQRGDHDSGVWTSTIIELYCSFEGAIRNIDIAEIKTQCSHALYGKMYGRDCPAVLCALS
jgi:hypothetical protein